MFRLKSKLPPSEENRLFPKLKLGNKVLQYSQSAIFLGLTFDKYLSWPEHINNLVKRTERAINLAVIFQAVW